jgi:hypothetical protein
MITIVRIVDLNFPHHAAFNEFFDRPSSLLNEPNSSLSDHT